MKESDRKMHFTVNGVKCAVDVNSHNDRYVLIQYFLLILKPKLKPNTIVIDTEEYIKQGKSLNSRREKPNLIVITNIYNKVNELTLQPFRTSKKDLELIKRFEEELIPALDDEYTIFTCEMEEMEYLPIIH